MKQSEANKMHELASLMWQEITEEMGNPDHFAISFNKEAQQMIVVAKMDKNVRNLQRALSLVFKGGVQKDRRVNFQQDTPHQVRQPDSH